MTRSSESRSKRETLLTHNEAADFLRIGGQTLYNWVNLKRISVVKMGRKNLYRESDLIRFMNERVQEAEF